ncbi:flagellar biosynthetic protein FliR [Deltaproteobacteria bacterium TL4]
MTNLLNYDAASLMSFIVVLIRVASIVGTAPILGNTNIPLQLKIALSFILALIVHPFIPSIQVYPSQMHHYLILVGSELLIGAVLGYVGKLLFASVEFAGSLISVQMGMGMANVIDPTSRQQVSLIAQFENFIALMIFLAMDAHHIIIQAIVQSYTLVPPGLSHLGQELIQEIIRLSAGIFIIGFQLGAPLITALFLANIILGLLSRSVPQIQIFVVGFPLTLFLGLVFLMIGTPFFVQAVRVMFEMFDNQVLNVLRLFKL